MTIPTMEKIEEENGKKSDGGTEQVQDNRSVVDHASLYHKTETKPIPKRYLYSWLSQKKYRQNRSSGSRSILIRFAFPSTRLHSTSRNTHPAPTEHLWDQFLCIPVVACSSRKWLIRKGKRTVWKIFLNDNRVIPVSMIKAKKRNGLKTHFWRLTCVFCHRSYVFCA